MPSLTAASAAGRESMAQERPGGGLEAHVNDGQGDSATDGGLSSAAKAGAEFWVLHSFVSAPTPSN